MIATSSINVQMDINAVPRSAMGAIDREESFDQSLANAEHTLRADQQAKSTDQNQRVDSRNPEVPVDDVSVPQGADSQSKASADDASTEQDRPGSTDHTKALLNQGPDTAGDDSPRANTLEGDPRSTNSSGKGLGSSSAFLASRPDGAAVDTGVKADHLVTAAALTVSPDASALAQGQAASAGQGAGAASATQVTNPSTALDPERSIRTGPRAIAKPAAVAKTYDYEAAEVARQHRDSIFKQLAFKLNKDGGHMQMRLDPPQLGLLDLNMVVDKGNVLSLSIAAERPEVAAMLDKHLGELESHLTEQGFNLDDAEVFTHDFADRSNANGTGLDGADSTESELHGPSEETFKALNEKGYVTANGLDFWV